MAASAPPPLLVALLLTAAAVCADRTGSADPHASYFRFPDLLQRANKFAVPSRHDSAALFPASRRFARSAVLLGGEEVAHEHASRLMGLIDAGRPAHELHAAAAGAPRAGRRGRAGAASAAAAGTTAPSAASVVKVDYDVTLRPNFASLDHLRGLQEVTCG
jgi:hypothetical protein